MRVAAYQQLLVRLALELATRTHLVKLGPVPVSTKVVQGVVTMAVILFLGAAGHLILLCPAGFDKFTIGFTRVFDVLECPDILTKCEMPTNVSTWNHAVNMLDDRGHAGKVLLKSFVEVLDILTEDVVAEHDPSLTTGFRK